MATSLKPPVAIAQADYNLAQQAILGGNYRVFANATTPGGVIQRVRNVDGTNYETTTYNSHGFGAALTKAIVVGENGLHGTLVTTASPPVYALTVPDYAINTDTNFAVGLACQHAIADLAVPTAFGGRRGDVIYEAHLPGYDPAGSGSPPVQTWFEIGAVTDRRIVWPSRGNIAVPSGMDGSEWTPRGRSTPGEFTVSATTAGQAEGLQKVMCMPLCIMIRIMADDVLEVARIFIPNVSLHNETSAGDGEAHGGGTARGMFKLAALFLADGTSS